MRIIPFDYNGIEFRAIPDEKGNPWFVAKDVCDVLEYTNGPKAVRDHCKYPKTLKQNDSFGLDIPSRGLTIISESDVYRLIIKSNMPEAEQFEVWVMEEVLPAIRKHGGYLTEEKVVTSWTYFL